MTKRGRPARSRFAVTSTNLRVLVNASTVAADVEALAETVGDRLDVLVNMAGEMRGTPR